MTTLSEDLAAWGAKNFYSAPSVSAAGTNFDALVARVRELEAEFIDAVKDCTAALDSRDTAYENGKRVWKDGETWFDAMVLARRERDELKDELAAARRKALEEALALGENPRHTEADMVWGIRALLDEEPAG